MPKQKNKTIGLCPCRVTGCAELADIRRRKNHDRGARYLDCPVHGVQGAFGKQQKFLDNWIDDNEIKPEQSLEPVPEIPEPEPEPSPEPVAEIPDAEPEQSPEPSPEVPEKKGGFFSDLNKSLNDIL